MTSYQLDDLTKQIRSTASAARPCPADLADSPPPVHDQGLGIRYQGRQGLGTARTDSAQCSASRQGPRGGSGGGFAGFSARSAAPAHASARACATSHAGKVPGGAAASPLLPLCAALKQCSALFSHLAAAQEPAQLSVLLFAFLQEM